MKMKKLLSVMIASAMVAGMAAGCSTPSGGGSEKSDAKGKVYYLNFKPEADDDWQSLAEAYTEETGVPVTVLTAASGEYEKTLKSEMAKSDAPTLFQVNGPVGLASWKDYCYDLKDSAIAGELTDDSFALMDGEKMAESHMLSRIMELSIIKGFLKKQDIQQKTSPTLIVSKM